MKKFLSMMLAVLMLLSMATVALADEEPAGFTVTGGTFTIPKTYTNGQYAPTETFTFTATLDTDSPYKDVTSVPTFTSVASTNGIGVATGAATTVTLPTYTHAGVYQYTVTESGDGNVGVSYKTFTMKVVVTNEGTGLKTTVYLTETNSAAKLDTITNKYDCGNLNVSKSVTTQLDADKDTVYSFALTLSCANNVNYTGTVWENNVATNTTVTLKNGNNTFTLKDGQTLKVLGLPVGAEYQVTETTPGVQAGHQGEVKVTYSGATAHKEATIAAGENNVAVVNAFNYTGSLVISKKVTGEMGNKNQEFEFTLAASLPSTAQLIKNDTNKVRVVTLDDGAGYTVYLKDGGTLTITDIPYNTTYTVTEVADSSYSSSYTFAAYTVAADGKTYTAVTDTEGMINYPKEELVFTNDSTANPPTGVSLDSLPYVLMLALAGAGLVLMIARKRRVED